MRIEMKNFTVVNFNQNYKVVVELEIRVTFKAGDRQMRRDRDCNVSS